MFSSNFNKGLYGPTRTSARTEIKDVLLRDHVLQNGEWHGDDRQKNPWKTSFSISFEKPSVGKNVKHGKVNVRTNVTSFVLGSEGGLSLATTAKDFDNKLQGAPFKAAPSQSTSIADFSPKYMSDEIFGRSGSVYSRTFAKGPQAQGSNAKNRAECQKLTTHLNTSHFYFGSDLNGYGTETRHSFEKKLEHSAKEPGQSTNLASKTAQETYKSSVFRHGDWNVAEPHFIKHSVTCNDFHIKPFTTSHNVGSKDTKGQKQEKDDLEYTESKVPSISPKDNPSHPYYQRSTHFVLGTNTDDRSSLHQKDFILSKRECLIKPPAAPPPISSKVLPNLEDCRPSCSTNTADFTDHKIQVTQISQGRAAETKLNRARHNTLAVVLSCDAQCHAGDRQASMTGSGYLHPPKDHSYLSPQREQNSRYRYLDSDGALLRAPEWPSPSETKEEFIPIEELAMGNGAAKLKQKKDDCLERITDNRKTHFQFGSDNKHKHTEQHDQFLLSLQLDPALPAAGKSEGPEQKYSHVYPSETTQQGRHRVSEPLPQDKVATIQQQMLQLNQQRFYNSGDTMNIHLRKAFLDFDTSLSGRISIEDLKSVLAKLGIDMEEKTLGKLIEMCDAGRTGFVDYEEFSKYLTKDALISLGNKPSKTSVMKTDFCSPEQRRLSSAQLRTIEMAKKIAPTKVNSHYFHEHHSGAPRLSTTAQDFVRPDRRPGNPRLSV